MTAPASSVTGVLVVRAWFEDHPSAPLRGVVTATDDVTSGELSLELGVASSDEICRVVRFWLESLRARDERARHGRP